jgi:DME family drug/metabolite transporter
MPAQLIALSSAISYAASTISARLGMSYSTPITITFISLVVHTLTLWTTVFLTGGIPEVSTVALVLFVIVGVLMPVMRLLTYTGIARIGASRSGSLRSTHPLFSTLIAITILHEEASGAVLVGTFLVVLGIIFISWQPEERLSPSRRWYILFPLTASFIAGVVHPITRYALSISNYPLFFAALVGIVSLLFFVGYLALVSPSEQPVWNRKALWPFLAAGLFESLGYLLFNTAMGAGPVVFVSPILGTIPMWVLVGSVVFLRKLEQVSFRTVIGSCSVVAGTIAISLGG